jgi:hypothetical protein
MNKAAALAAHSSTAAAGQIWISIQQTDMDRHQDVLDAGPTSILPMKRLSKTANQEEKLKKQAKPLELL